VKTIDFSCETTDELSQWTWMHHVEIIFINKQIKCTLNSYTIKSLCKVFKTSAESIIL